MQNYYFALRCFMLDFWDHSLGECQVSQYTNIERAIYHAADTNISSPLGSRVITDVPRCLWLKAGGRICWVHSVRGEEIADPDPEVGLRSGWHCLHTGASYFQDVLMTAAAAAAGLLGHCSAGTK
jgi:hypothetical protein